MASSPGNTGLWEEELAVVESSRTMARCRQLKLLLRWLICRLLDGRVSELNEYDVAREFFGLPDHDPRIDPHVRKQLSRLRGCLKGFYSGEGRGRVWQIRLTNGFVPALVQIPPGTLPRLPEVPKGERLVVAVEPFAGTEGSVRVADRLTDELLHRLAEMPNVLVKRYQDGSRQPLLKAPGMVLLRGRVWPGEEDRFVVFALVMDGEGFVLRSYRGEQRACDGIPEWASAVSEMLKP